MPKKAKKPLRVEVDVIVRFPDRDGQVTPSIGRFLEKAMEKALAKVYPDCNIRGLWVHRGLPRENIGRASALYGVETTVSGSPGQTPVSGARRLRKPSRVPDKQET